MTRLFPPFDSPVNFPECCLRGKAVPAIAPDPIGIPKVLAVCRSEQVPAYEVNILWSSEHLLGISLACILLLFCPAQAQTTATKSHALSQSQVLQDTYKAPPLAKNAPGGMKVLPVVAMNPLTSPELIAILKSLSSADLPTLKDAQRCVENLENLARKLPPQSKAQVNTLRDQIKTLFQKEGALEWAQEAIKKLPDMNKKVQDSQQKLDQVKATPALGINGKVDREKWDFWIKAASDDLTKATAEREKLIALPKFAETELLKKLAATNSEIANYMQMQAKPTDLVHTLASCFYAIAIRAKLQLNFAPAVSYTWVAMRKMQPGGIALKRSLAMKELVGWVAKNHVAQKDTENGMKRAVNASFQEDRLNELFVSGMITLKGVTDERLTEERIKGCLEVILYTPEPNENAPQVMVVLQSLVTGKNPNDTIGKQFTREVITAAVAKVSPTLGKNEDVIKVLIEILQNQTD